MKRKKSPTLSLADQQRKILQFYRRRKRLPSYSEMLEIFGWQSKNSVFKLVAKFIQQGFFARDSYGKLIPARLYDQSRILGNVEAGWPTPAEEELADTISLDDYLLGNKEATFLLRVSGDSMKDAGIMPGDLVIVDRSATAKPGDIVIAEVDSNWTIKYLRRNKQQSYLEAANQNYQPIFPQTDLKIAAVVKGVVRKY